MIGSSLDGLDLSLAQFTFDGPKLVDWELIANHKVDLPTQLLPKLRKASELSVSEYFKLDASLGRWVGTAVKQWLEAGTITPTVIGLHGVTTLHDPSLGYSHQLGHGAHIAAATKIDTIVDFRTLDIALGGQGAPLVPRGERDLFPEYQHFLNLGGICNITLTTESDIVKSGDVTGCNQVLNALASILGNTYDKGGEMARTGKLETDLLRKLSEFHFLNEPFPRSLDNATVQKNWIGAVMNSLYSPENRATTFVEHIAEQVEICVVRETAIQGTLLLTGGGTHHTFLTERIGATLKRRGIETIVPPPSIIDYKEAIIFAYLAVLRSLGLPTTITEATGASARSSGGAFFQGKVV